MSEQASIIKPALAKSSTSQNQPQPQTQSQSASSLYKNIKPILSPHPREIQPTNAASRETKNQNQADTKQRTSYKSSGSSPSKSNTNAALKQSSRSSGATTITSGTLAANMSNEILQQSPRLRRNKALASQQPQVAQPNMSSQSTIISGIAAAPRKTSTQQHAPQNLVRPMQFGSGLQFQSSASASSMSSAAKKQSLLQQKHRQVQQQLQQQFAKTTPRKRNQNVQNNPAASGQDGRHHNFQQQHNQQLQGDQIIGGNLDCRNNVFERLYKTQVQNIKLTAGTNSSNFQQLAARNQTSSYQGLFNNHLNDDSSGGMTAHEFNQLVRDQKKQKSRKTAGGTSIISASATHLRSDRKNIHNSSSSIRSSPMTRRKKSSAVVKDVPANHASSSLNRTAAVPNRRYNRRKDDEFDEFGTSSKQPEEEEDSQDQLDLMDLNLAKNAFQPQNETIQTQQTEGPAEEMNQPLHEPDTHSDSMAGVTLNEVSDATSSVRYVAENIYPEAPRTNKITMTPVTKLTFNVNLNELHASTNFAVDNQHHPGSQSHRNQLSRRHQEDDLQNDIETRRTVKINRHIKFEEEEEEESQQLDGYRTQALATEVSQFGGDSPVRSTSERTPFRRSRSERKHAWLETNSSVCSAIESRKVQQKQPLGSSVFDYQRQQSASRSIQSDISSLNESQLTQQQTRNAEMDAFELNAQAISLPAGTAASGVTNQDLEFHPAALEEEDVIASTEQQQQFLASTTSTIKLTQHLEPVKEVADEDRNYLSYSPKHGAGETTEDSLVEIVDPEVQLFDGADGGEEQQPFEGRFRDSDSDEMDEDDSECNDYMDDANLCTSTAPIEESKKEGQHYSNGPGGHNSGPHQGVNQSSIDQLYGQISMFDQITEENYYGRGEESDDDEGEDATGRIRRFRQQIEHLNSDLHDLIYSGEDEESGAEDAADGPKLNQRSKNSIFKKMGSGKPQNLDLLPASYSMDDPDAAATSSHNVVGLNLDMVESSINETYYIEQEQQQQFQAQSMIPPSMPSHMIKEVVQVLDEDTYIVQESIFNQRYESEDMGNSSHNGSESGEPPVDESNEENEDKADSEEQVNQPLENRPPSDEEDEVVDDDDDDSDSYGQQYGLIIAAGGGGANELIQPMMAMEDNLLGPPNADFGPPNFFAQEGGNFVIVPAHQSNLVVQNQNSDLNEYDIPQNNFYQDHQQQQQQNQDQQQLQQQLQEHQQLLLQEAQPANILPHQVLYQLPIQQLQAQPCTDCLDMQAQHVSQQEQLYAAQGNLQLMEEKLAMLTEQMIKLHSTTTVLEAELHKKDAVIEEQSKDMQMLRGQNEHVSAKLSTVQKMHVGRQSMQKDLLAYQKLVKDQSECIESLHSTKSDDKKLMRQLQKENQKLKDQMKATSSSQSNGGPRRLVSSVQDQYSLEKVVTPLTSGSTHGMPQRNYGSATALTGCPNLSGYQQKALIETVMPSQSQTEAGLSNQTMAASQGRSTRKTNLMAYQSYMPKHSNFVSQAATLQKSSSKHRNKNVIAMLAANHYTEIRTSMTPTSSSLLQVSASQTQIPQRNSLLMARTAEPALMAASTMVKKSASVTGKKLQQLMGDKVEYSGRILS